MCNGICMSVAACNSCNVFFIVVFVIRACRCKEEGGGDGCVLLAQNW